VRENLMLAAMGKHRHFSHGYGRYADKVASLIADLGLPMTGRQPSTYSGGMQRRPSSPAGFLLTDPDILILDRPKASTSARIDLSPAGTRRMPVYVIVISSDFEVAGVWPKSAIIVSSGILRIADLRKRPHPDEEKRPAGRAPLRTMLRNQAFAAPPVRNLAATWTLIDREKRFAWRSRQSPVGPAPPGETAMAAGATCMLHVQTFHVHGQRATAVQRR
jgi:hypothetical protein